MKTLNTHDGIVEITEPDGFRLELDTPYREIHLCLCEYLKDLQSSNYWDTNPQKSVAGAYLLEAEKEDQRDTVLAILARLANPQCDYQYSHMLANLLRLLLLRDLPYSEQNLLAALQLIISRVKMHYVPVGSLVNQLQKHIDAQGLTLEMREALHSLKQNLRSAYDKTPVRKINALLGNTSAVRPDACEPWADSARAFIETLPPQEVISWEALFSHALEAEAGRPSAKWNKAAQKNIEAVAKDTLIQCFCDWFRNVSSPTFPSNARQTAPQEPQAADLLTDPRAYDNYLEMRREYWESLHELHSRISEKNISLLKGLAWYAANLSEPELASALGHMGEVAFHSIRERGPWASRAGNAAIWALGQMPNGVGVGPLARLRTKLRDRGALKLIAAGIESAAAKAGMTVDELEDLAVPTGGLDADGTRHETFGEDGAATLTLDAKNAKTNLQWFGADGKPRKAVPAAVRANFAAEVKALKAAEDEIKQALGAQAARLDRALLDERTWTGAEWRERYLSHPILGNMTRRLIWTFDGQDGLPLGKEIVSASGDVLPDLRDETVVKLWHPVGHEPIAVMRWRDALEAQGIVQPFKQAHREVYLLTDAERNTRTYSNRFAAHILKQHQFNSLAVLRGWKNQLRLMVDDSYPPAIKMLPQYNLRAEFWVEGIGDDYGTDTNETGTYLRLVTDQVRFYALDAATNYAHAGGGGYGANHYNTPAEALPLDQVPPLVLSEVMRDVDLFVGVASLGNDPNWADGGPQGRFRNYWQEYSFGDLTETAKTRADVLARLLPRLKIADRCRLDGKFLVVRGDVRTYKIHLGSGNILMEPNDQYLCIVAKSGADDGGSGLMLPFEGDRTLSVIISKAFLLAADTRITDPTITRQIGVK